MDLAWPEFPDPTEEAAFLPEGTAVELPGGERVELDSDHVYMSIDYWLRVTDYVIEVRRVRATYEAVYGSGADEEGE